MPRLLTNAINEVRQACSWSAEPPGENRLSNAAVIYR